MTFREAQAVPSARQPITARMRALHRVSRHWPGASLRLGNERPIVSFTFDDVPDSATTEGAGLVEAAGARATFFVATSLFGAVTPDWRVAEADDVARLSERGHEIGLHSHGHLPVALMGRRDFGVDLDRARQRLAPIAVPDCYAYPYGFASPLHRGAVSRRVRASRTTHPGVNRGRVDPHYLRSHAFGEALSTPSAVDRVLDEAAAAGGWLIFTGHDVRPRPSPYGCTPELLRHAIEGAASRGMALCTMARALDACGLPGRPS